MNLGILAAEGSILRLLANRYSSPVSWHPVAVEIGY